MEDEDRAGDRQEGAAERVIVREGRRAAEGGGRHDEAREDAPAEAIGSGGERGVGRLHLEPPEPEVFEDLAGLERHVVARARELLDASRSARCRAVAASTAASAA